MRNFVVVSFLLLFGHSAISLAEETAGEMDKDLMQTIEDTNDSLSSNIALQRKDQSLEDAQLLKELFVVVEKHFLTQKDAAEALEITRNSQKLTANVIEKVEATDFDGAISTATELSRACKKCHTFYKVD